MLCRLLAGGLPEEAPETGFDFLQGSPFEPEPPDAVEDRDAVVIPLDREKTALILAEAERSFGG